MSIGNRYNGGGPLQGVVVEGQVDATGNITPPTGGSGTTPEFVTSATPTSVTATIPNAGSLSPGVAVGGKVASITFPATWTAAAVTFQGSIDGGATYVDMWDIVSGTATETTVSSANVTALVNASQRNLRVSLVDWISYTHIKVRSGTAAAPVAQGGARAFIIGLAG